MRPRIQLSSNICNLELSLNLLHVELIGWHPFMNIMVSPENLSGMFGISVGFSHCNGTLTVKVYCCGLHLSFVYILHLAQ
jgi:hypothetical protein